jgi:hypothetical protein
MPAMTREILEMILKQAPGFSTNKEGWSVETEHRASLYLMLGQSSSTLAEVSKITLEKEFLRAELRDRTVHFVRYEHVAAVASRPPRDAAAGSSRTGF